MKLIKKLLQDHEAREREEKEEAVITRAKTTTTSKQTDRTTASDEDAFKATVRNMLFLDKKMNAVAGPKKRKAITRIKKDSQQKTKDRKQAATTVLGNSRGSSSQLRLLPEPTFNKKRHQKQKESQRLQKIAILLNKSANKKKKPTVS
jgi:hypothetical protein